MLAHDAPRVGYVVKRYPRYSETFIVNEILAHEASGLDIEIFSLRPPADTHFQDAISRVRAPVTYLTERGTKASDFWGALEVAGDLLPGFWGALEQARGYEASDVYQAVLLACEVRRRRLDHLHAHFATSATSVASLAARFAGVPFTFTMHAKDIFHENVQPADIRRKLSLAEAVVTVSDYNRAFLRSTYGEAATRVERIYNGLDLDRFRYQTPGDRPPTIVAAGRLVEKKGFADLIAACAVLERCGVPFQCRIIGAGPLEENLRCQIEGLGLTPCVELLGPRPQSELIQHVRQAALFVVPSVVGADGNRDGLPTVLLEAMALGTPCISTPVTGIPEVVHDGGTGLLVPCHDPAALANAAERLLGDSSLGVTLAGNARKLIEAKFDIHCNTEQLRVIFRSASAASLAAD